MSTALDGRNRFRSSHAVRRAMLAGARWEYFASGRGPRGLLVLGGALSFGDTSHRLINTFEGSRRVVSPSYPHVATAGQVVDGLIALLDAERLDDVDVFGHGLGAGLAHLLVRRAPERVARIALAGFGLTTPFRAAAGRALLEMFGVLPYGAVRQHYERIFQRHAAYASDESRANDLLVLAGDLLDRHSRLSALHHLQLQADLFRTEEPYHLGRPVEAHALLMFANDDPCFTRTEQDNLERCYPGATVMRHLNAGRLIGLAPTQEVERKLEHFFRVEARRPTETATAEDGSAVRLALA